mmetsp:Transcript_18103/g.43807  ORF Transcript_18103/g.43807 Transcript_18103/m.43807 type:complete len:239 (+) Transcript_18103:278-994(+)
MKVTPTTSSSTTTTATAKQVAMAFTASCHCGSFKASINTLPEAPPIRLVCYCKDCRGYYETLSRKTCDEQGICHTKNGKDLPSALDNWGGVDWMAMYPRDITIQQGLDCLTTVKIRPNSPVRQVYTTCCNTPLFRFGGMSVLVNTNTLVPLVDEYSTGPAELPPVTFRIIGRDAWKTGLISDQEKPKTSWSVPFKWFWTMPFRLHSALMEPMPLDIPKAEDCPVLHGFKEGSSSTLEP